MAQPLTDAINSLITYSNSVTGASDQTLSEAVATLASGYGQGGGTELILSWDFTQGLTDTVIGRNATLTNATRDSEGVHFTSDGAYISVGATPCTNCTYEIDISAMERQGTAHGRLFMINGNDGLCYRSTGYWGAYTSGWTMSTITDPSYFVGHTFKVVYNKYNSPSFYRDNELFLSVPNKTWTGLWRIGANGQSYYNMTITAVRIYLGDTTQ